jgi:hypothetical protein
MGNVREVQAREHGRFGWLVGAAGHCEGPGLAEELRRGEKSFGAAKQKRGRVVSVSGG